MAKKRANGEGSIRKRKDGRWEGRYTAGHTPEGKAIYRNVLGKTQAEVVEKLRKAIEETKGLDVAKAGQYTMGQWMRVWYENYATIKVRPSSHATYRGIIKNHIDPAIGNIPLTKLTTLDLQKFYRDLLTGGRVERKESEKKPKGLGPKTVRNIHQIISSALQLAIHQKLIAHNPAEGCALPRVERNEMKTLTADQLTAFLQEAKRTGVFEMYYLELATGLRRGELLGLKWTDVDFGQGTLTVRRQISRINGQVVEAPLKTKNAYRVIPLGEQALAVLQEQKAKTVSEYVFPSPSGGPISPDSVRNMLRRVLKRAGLPYVRFHDLRHPYVKHTTKKYNSEKQKTQATKMDLIAWGFCFCIVSYSRGHGPCRQSLYGCLGIHIPFQSADRSARKLAHPLLQSSERSLAGCFGGPVLPASVLPGR